jgi:hypothetical protein
MFDTLLQYYVYFRGNKFNLYSVKFSIIYDFLLRMAGKEDLLHSQLRMLPILGCQRADLIAARTLRLVSVTKHYAPLWNRNVKHSIRHDAWSFSDPRLVHEDGLPWSDLPETWERDCALRGDFARRQALLEIDVLVAQAMKFTWMSC